MTKITRIAFIGTWLAAAIVSKSSSAMAGDAANVYLNITITLNGVTQTSDGGIGKIRISTLDVIEAIGNDASKVFSPKAKLLLKIPVGMNAGPVFVVRDIVNKTNAVDFEVSSSTLWSIQIGDSVTSTRTNLTGVISGTQATIWEFTFQSSSQSFDVQGYTTESLDNRGNPGEKLADLCPVTLSSKVTGTGYDAAGNPVVLQGTVSASGRKVVKVN
jgi:hypothetical protein